MKDFNKSEKWSLKHIKKTGLPRPHWILNEKYFLKNGKRYLSKIIPIPYQSTPSKHHPIRLEIENEKYVVENDLCPYCGLSINKEEDSIRWMIEKEEDVKESSESSRDLVPSDFRPFHLDCMKQARIFCPFMRTLKDSDFDIQKQNINLKLAKKYFKEFYKIKWESKSRIPIKYANKNIKNSPLNE
jgi:hypothetical protein